MKIFEEMREAGLFLSPFDVNGKRHPRFSISLPTFWQDVETLLQDGLIGKETLGYRELPSAPDEPNYQLFLAKTRLADALAKRWPKRYKRLDEKDFENSLKHQFQWVKGTWEQTFEGENLPAFLFVVNFDAPFTMLTICTILSGQNSRDER